MVLFPYHLPSAASYLFTTVIIARARVIFQVWREKSRLAGPWCEPEPETRSSAATDVIVALVGNLSSKKTDSDLAENQRVSREEGEAYTAQDKIVFVETSAKSGLHIKALFRQLAQQQLPSADNAATNPGQQQEGETVNVKLDASAPTASTIACSC